MKSMKFLMTIMLVALCVSFASCSSNDELQDKGIVGEWFIKKEVSANERRITIKSDGTLYVRDFDGKEENSLGTFKYTFDVKTSTGQVIDNDGSIVGPFKYLDQKLRFDMGVNGEEVYTRRDL